MPFIAPIVPPSPVIFAINELKRLTETPPSHEVIFLRADLYKEALQALRCAGAAFKHGVSKPLLRVLAVSVKVHTARGAGAVAAHEAVECALGRAEKTQQGAVALLAACCDDAQKARIGQSAWGYTGKSKPQLRSADLYMRIHQDQGSLQTISSQRLGTTSIPPVILCLAGCGRAAGGVR